jgi:hypothetical protein
MIRMSKKPFIIGESYQGYDRQGDRVTGTIRGILTTRWSTWLSIESKQGIRLIQERL